MYNLAWLQTGTALRMDQQQFLHLPGFSLAAPICWQATARPTPLGSPKRAQDKPVCFLFTEVFLQKPISKC